MSLPTEYDIPFNRIESDRLPCLAQSRLLEFLQNKGVLNEFLQALIDLETDDYTTALDLLKNRCIPYAVGESLDFLGRIVKQKRVNLNQADKAWFGVDGGSGYVGRMDTARAWIAGYSIFQDIVANDPDYRQFIAAKAIKNTVKFCSVPDIQRFVKTAYGIECSVRRIAPMVIQIVVPPSTPIGLIFTLRKFYTTDGYDYGYILPVMAGVRVDDVVTT
jgi:hypothetical protein